MTKEELSALIEQARTAASEVERNNLLLQLHDNCTQVITASEVAATQRAALEKETAELAKQNNSLWLKLSAQPTTSAPEGNDETIVDAPKMKYEDLFQ